MEGAGGLSAGDGDGSQLEQDGSASISSAGTATTDYHWLLRRWLADKTISIMLLMLIV